VIIEVWLIAYGPRISSWDETPPNRYDKAADAFLAFTQLVSIKI
jgi:hypothetical protein